MARRIAALAMIAALIALALTLVWRVHLHHLGSPEGEPQLVLQLPGGGLVLDVRGSWSVVKFALQLS